jgi:hypothetical protein
MDNPADLSVVHDLAPDAQEAELRKMSTVLDGSVSAAADRIGRLHKDLGISYFTFHKTAATSWQTLENLADAVK